MLPTNSKTPWPPPAMRPILAEIKELDGWYSGDDNELFPADSTIRSWKTAWRNRRVVVGSLGQSLPIHVPLAPDVARTSADLLFSEPPVITAQTDAGQARLDAMLDEAGLDAMLLENAELAAALTGIYWRVTWDLATVRSQPIVSFVQPDNAAPEWSWGQLTAVTFWRVLPRPAGASDTEVWRHLERHSAGLVEHGLYVGDTETLGRPAPLTEHPDTMALAATLTGDQTIALPGVPITAGYIPNMRPNRKNRGSMNGRADIDQSFPVLRSIDDTWTSWLRDIRLGQGRIIVPREYLRPGKPGDGAIFDVDKEVYEPLTMPAPASGTGTGLTITQFAIRVAEHQQTIQALVQQLVTAAGYSLQTFGLTGDGAAAATATEIVARERLSMITRGKKTRYWGDGLRRMLFTLQAVDYFLRFPGSVAPEPVTIAFGDSVSDDPKDTASIVELLNRAQAASKETLVRMLHPDWDEVAIQEEVARILNEAGLTVPDPIGAGEQMPGMLADPAIA